MFVKSFDHARVHRFSDIARNGSLVVPPDAEPFPQRCVGQKVSRHVFQASVQVTGPHPLRYGCGCWSWGTLPIKMNVHRAEHFKSISITKTELLADVGQRHSFPYICVEYLMSHHDGVMNLGVGRDPSIGDSCELRFSFRSKLIISLDPIHHFRERINNQRICRGYKQIIWCLLRPRSQRILVNAYLVTNSINAQYLSFAAIVSQTFPESRA